MEKKEIRDILEIAIHSGKIMLENGAETYRCEETINRMCQSRGINVESFVVPTGIFLSCESDGEYYSYVKRTKQMSINLEVITRVNDFSRKFVESNICINEASEALRRIDNAPDFKPYIKYFYGGVAAGAFSLLFKGTMLEAFFAFLVGVSVVASVDVIGKYARSFFLKNVMGGMIITFNAIVFIELTKVVGLDLNLDSIIIGAIMPLVPGVALTNALRDTISGDLVSGMSRLAETIITAIAIALGVGLVLQFYVGGAAWL